MQKGAEPDMHLHENVTAASLNTPQGWFSELQCDWMAVRGDPTHYIYLSRHQMHISSEVKMSSLESDREFFSIKPGLHMVYLLSGTPLLFSQVHAAVQSLP